MSQRLRRLDHRLGIDHQGRSEWIWAVPTFILLATLTGFILIGQITGMTAVVAAPVGAVIALVMAGLAVAYMTPLADDAGGPPHEQRDDTPLGTPGGPWVVVKLLPVRSPGDRDDAEPLTTRELVGAAGTSHGHDVRALSADDLPASRMETTR